MDVNGRSTQSAWIFAASSSRFAERGYLIKNGKSVRSSSSDSASPWLFRLYRSSRRDWHSLDKTSSYKWLRTIIAALSVMAEVAQLWLSTQMQVIFKRLQISMSVKQCFLRVLAGPCKFSAQHAIQLLFKRVQEQRKKEKTHESSGAEETRQLSATLNPQAKSNQRKFRSSNFRLYWKLPVALAASMFDSRDVLAGRNCAKCCVFP